MDYLALAHRFDEVRDAPAYPLERDMPLAEYRVRIARARERMAAHDLSALVITTSTVGRWFTSWDEPGEWHDQCQSRANLFILTHQADQLYMAPTVGGERLNTCRRATWVTDILALAETSRQPRSELWDIRQLPTIFQALGVASGRIGFELGQHMTLGMSPEDFGELRVLLPDARIVDASPVVRWLMAVLTPWEIEQLRTACAAGVAIHEATADILRAGLTERQLMGELSACFRGRYQDIDYTYDPVGAWDTRNTSGGLGLPFHGGVSDRPFAIGDTVFRGRSGVSYRHYAADIDRVWFLGQPPQEVRDLYRLAWECNRAMAEAVRPGVACSDVYRAGAHVEARFGRTPRLTGRTGHGYRNVGGLSVYPGCETELEPGMLLSVEPLFATPWGFFDLEDQYVVTETGAECLHEPAPEQLPVIS